MAPDADRAGIGAAAICAVHCLITPWLIGVAPLLGAAALGEPAETLLLSTSLGISSYVVTSSGVRAHNRWRAVLLITAGAMVLVAARAFGDPESTIGRVCSLCGAGCVVCGHALNIRVSRCSKESVLQEP